MYVEELFYLKHLTDEYLVVLSYQFFSLFLILLVFTNSEKIAGTPKIVLIIKLKSAIDL